MESWMKKVCSKRLAVSLTVIIAAACVMAAGGSPNLLSARGKPFAGDMASAAQPATDRMPIYGQWRTFTTKDGLPSNKAFCVRVDGATVWIGTDAGLASYQDDQWRTYSTEDGLAHDVVMAIEVSPQTGDLWVATMGGLSRFSAGRFDTYNQFNSGLVNDVVYGVTCTGDEVWVATASGISRLNTLTGQWEIYNEKNTPMHEIWTYAVSADNDIVYTGVWGGGILEYNIRTGRWREYRDPDKEMELDLYPDDGLVHDIVASVSYVNGILWIGTYFGLNRYDGARWQGYFDHDQGLVSNFINFVKGRGSAVWICTDKGLNSFDGATWITYQRQDETGRGEVWISSGKEIDDRQQSETAIAHNFVLGVDFQDDFIWVTTSQGVSRGVALPESNRPSIR